ncbi:MAG: oligosaccharide flippase family protein [Gammaproteobacteria bacterium]
MNVLMNAQNLKKDAAYVYSAYALRYLSVIVLIPYYGRVLGPTSYGTVLTAMSLMALVWIVVNFGFSSTGSRSLAYAADPASHAQIVSRQLSARLILAPAGVLIGIFGTLLSPALRSDPWFGVVATLLGFMNSMNLGWFYQGLRRFRLSLIFEAMAYPLNVAFIFIFVRNSGDGINALLSVLAASCISAACAYVVALRIVRPVALSIRGGIEEIKSASTIFLQGVNAMLMTSGSTYLLSVISTPEQVGYFGSVEKLISFALAFLQPAAQVLMPTITHRSKHVPGEAHHLIRKGIAFEMGYGVCACIGGLILAPYIIPLAFGARFAPSIEMMRIMVFALPFAAFTHAVGSYVLLPTKNERLLVIAFVVGNVFNIAMIVVLAGKYGGTGVSVSRVAGECITAFVLAYLALRARPNNARL